MLTNESIQQIQKTTPLTVGEKAEQFISYWSRLHPKPGTVFPFKVKDQPAAISSAYAEDETELKYIVIDFLERSQGWVEIIQPKIHSLITQLHLISELSGRIHKTFCTPKTIYDQCHNRRFSPLKISNHRRITAKNRAHIPSVRKAASDFFNINQYDIFLIHYRLLNTLMFTLDYISKVNNK